MGNISTCKVQWADHTGQPTPDNDRAVAIAFYTFPKEIKDSSGNVLLRLVESVPEESWPICQVHLDRAIKEGLDKQGWRFSPNLNEWDET